MNMKKPFLGALKQYSNCYNFICRFLPYSLHVCQINIFLYFISMHMKFQVFISTGGISETIFIVELQSINYRLISISLEISLYQVQMILLFLGTVNVEGKIMA